MGFTQIYNQYESSFFLVSSSFVKSNVGLFGAPEVNVRVYECFNICLVPVVVISYLLKFFVTCGRRKFRLSTLQKKKLNLRKKDIEM